MKFSGDIPQQDLDHMIALDEAEKDTETCSLPNERKAQIYVCLAHDWYEMDCEEEGNRLLLKADKVSPGYFKGPVIEHQLEDENFDVVVKRITLELVKLLVGNLNDET